MKFKKISLIAIGVFLSSLGYASTYSQSDVDTFLKTNQCPSCDLSGMGLSGNHSGAILTKSNLTNSSVSANLSASDLTDAVLSDSYWQSSNLTFDNFTNAHLINVTFSRSNLEGANFTGAVIINTDFSDTNLYNAIISPEQLASAKSVCNATLPDGSKGQCS